MHKNDNVLSLKPAEIDDAMHLWRFCYPKISPRLSTAFALPADKERDMREIARKIKDDEIGNMTLLSVQTYLNMRLSDAEDDVRC